jgi:hypothetical protein
VAVVGDLTIKVYRPGERPDIEVLVDGVWREGELRMWIQREDGTWWAQVTWRSGPGSSRIGTFHEIDVRLAPEP